MMQFLIESWGGAGEVKLAAALSQLDGVFVAYDRSDIANFEAERGEALVARHHGLRAMGQGFADLRDLQQLQHHAGAARHIGVIGDWGYRSRWDQMVIQLLESCDASYVLLRHPVHRLTALLQEMRVCLRRYPEVAAHLLTPDEALCQLAAQSVAGLDLSRQDPGTCLFWRLLDQQVTKDWQAMTYEVTPILYEDIFCDRNRMLQLAKQLSKGSYAPSATEAEKVRQMPLPWISASDPSARRMLNRWPEPWREAFFSQLERVSLSSFYEGLGYRL